MATKSGTIGTTSGTKYTTFADPVSIGVTMSAGQYPDGSLTIGIASGTAYWKNTHTSGNRSATLYLCDSSGNNRQTLFGIVLGGGGTNSTLKSATISNATGLTGKALYFVMEGDTDYIKLWGQCAVTVTYSNRSYTLAKASNPTAGGSVTLGATSAVYNTKINVSASANTGYSFSSWSKSSGTLSSTTTNPTTFTMPASNATVTANFTHNTYSVAKAANPSAGGSVTLGASSGYYNNKINVTASANTGYTFSSWSKSSGTLSSTTTNPTTFTLPAANSTVTANFTHNTYTVSSAISPTGGGTVALSASSGYYSSTIKVTATANTGYTFSSWSKSSGTLSSTTANPTTFTLPNGNSTVTANFIHNSYSVASAVSPSGGGSVSLGATSGYYNDKIKITATASTGYTFSSWSKSAGTLESTTANPTTFTLPNANSTVTATFTHNEYSVASAVSPSGGGTVTLGASSGYYNDKIQVTATASTGYTFSSWSKSAGTLSSTTDNPTTFTLPNSNSTVTATFTHNTYTLSSAVSPSGGGSVNLGKSTAYYADTIQISATAATGYTFSSWTKTSGTLSDTSASTTTFTMPNGNATVTANFTHNTYNVSSAVSPVGGGTVTLGATSGYYDDKIQISASPATGYSFNSWNASGGTIANASASTTTFTLPAANSTVTASFTQNTYTLSASASPQAGGTVYISKSTCYYGDQVSISATSSSGYTFSKWTSTAGTISSTTSSATTFTMPASNATLTATFNKIDYNVTTSANPANSGTVTASPSTAQIGDTVTLSYTETTGFAFDSYSSNPQVAITNNTFTMPASNVAITGNFRAVKSTGSLDSSSYYGGDVAVLTIVPADPQFNHSYRLKFNDDMDTGEQSVAAGITSVNIYIPVAWCEYLNSGISVTNGTLDLKTYDGNTLLGTYTITGLTYTALDGTIPQMSVWRCDSSGSTRIDGVNGKYSITIPQGLSSYKLVCGQDYVQDPALTGDLLPGNKKSFIVDANQMIELQMTFSPGSSLPDETFSIFRDLPKVVIVKKKC